MEDFTTYYPLLFAIAYRMLGSASDAEDIVQECYLRYAKTPREEIHTLKSYLTTIVTHLCLDQLKSARQTREQYIGPWLPEPVLTFDGEQAALQTLEQRESLSLAFLVLLECLTPLERAIFLLHDIFAYSHEEIASIVGKSVSACRQSLHRAKEKIAERHPRFTSSQEAQRRMLSRFLAACQQGDIQSLTSMLAEDITSWADSGGKVSGAGRHPIYGREKVIRLLLGLVRKYATMNLSFSIAAINGALGILVWTGDVLFEIACLEMTEERIYGIRHIVNPDKLTYIQQQLQQAPGTVGGT
jgi:RNA polymerase sigma-70 factor (ECF subfamily)